MHTISCEEMKEMDSHAINVIGIPSIVLMENAALKVIKNIENMNCSYFAVICGTGNNGGDGLAVARHLLLKHKKVNIYIIGDLEKGTKDFNINLNILKNLNASIIKILDIRDFEILKSDIQKSELVVDAIFGIGITRNVEGSYYDVIDIINRSAKKIVSVDIPSGLNGDTGEVMGIAVKASKTIVFHMMKKGLVNIKEYTGELIVEDISIPYDQINK